MAERDFLLADLGEGLEEATVVEWFVEVGDQVELNQVLCTVESAKAEVEVPSPFAGTIVELGGRPGDTIEVGSLLARIDSDPGTEHRTDAATDETEPTGRVSTLVGYGHDGTADRSRRRRHGDQRPSPPSAVTPAPRPLATPPVRLLARRLGVDLADLSPGSGPGGVVTRSDVETAAEQHATPGAGARPDDGHHTIAVTGIRARIAERMTTSRAEIPDATATVVADCTRLLEVRRALNDHADGHGMARVVTPFALLCHLAVVSLARTPVLNATFDPSAPEIRVHDLVHLGVGTATDRGLVVTVVRDADSLALHELAAEIARLAEGARHGGLSPHELTGSTFTISNYGALGLDEGIPVINHPEAAILGVGSIAPRPHVVDGAVVARPTTHLTLAFDHRVCDGSDAGRFLNDLRELVERPELALLS